VYGIARRLALVAALALTACLLAARPTLAGGWGHVDCSQDPTNPLCQVTAGTPGWPSDPGSGGSGGGGQVSCHDSNGAAAPCYDPVLGWMGGDGCYYKRVDANNPPPGAVQPGAWYRVTCGNTGNVVWMADGQAPGPALLGQQAVRLLMLPSPLIRTNPSVAGQVLVQVPVWLWLDAASWGTRSATASVPGISVTATATPTSVDWSPGDGSSLTCRGPGTAWKAGDNPAAASPTCGHTYRTSSAGAAGQTFTLSATTMWRVSWAGAGQSGTVPDLQTTARVDIAVAESQAVTGG
jgi:hypothetical protein